MYNMLVRPLRTRRALLSITLASSMALSACATDGTTSQFLGGALGAVTGYAACRLSSANDTECIALVLAGATAGVLIARHIDARDRERRNAAVATFLNEGQNTTTWQNPETSNSGSLQLLGTTTDAQGRECRQINEQYHAGGNTVPETYTMCRTGPNGSWQTQT